MDSSHMIIDALWRPSFLLKRDLLKKRLDKSLCRTNDLDWNQSALNPKNRVDSLDDSKSSWRVDGATICLTQLFVRFVGTGELDIQQSTMDIFLPDQDDYPPALFMTLDASRGVPIRDSDYIARLGISKYVCRALDFIYRSDQTFLQRYGGLPFGTQLVFENVSADFNDMKFSMVPMHNLERKSLSVKVLKASWAREIPEESWPEPLDSSNLQIVKQLHDTIILVRVVHEQLPEPTLYILKSSTVGFDHLYHELKFLLRIPQHAHIMPRPRYLVTKLSRFGGKRGVYGFLLPYYPEGSIRDRISSGMIRGDSMSQKLRWCKQVTLALIHIMKEGKTFYSDLRPDNVLLSTLSSENTSQHTDQDVVLCDFEQRGNWHEWSSPEILYPSYMENLRSNIIQYSTSYWDDLIAKYRDRGYTNAVYDFPDKTNTTSVAVRERNHVWFALSRESQEKAQVYTLGLFFYCVFEGVPNVRKSIANEWLNEGNVEFPAFETAPKVIQELIKACTVDAPEWAMNTGDDRLEGHTVPPPRAPRVIRVAGKLHSEQNLPGVKCKHKESVDEVFETAGRWWETELGRASAFLESREWKEQKFGQRRLGLGEVLSALSSIGED